RKLVAESDSFTVISIERWQSNSWQFDSIATKEAEANNDLDSREKKSIFHTKLRVLTQKASIYSNTTQQFLQFYLDTHRRGLTSDKLKIEPDLH
ncbi:unnamed protein product, partial [Heterotrigona itama]